MQCHLQANRIWCPQIQCLLNLCRAARHFWQNVFCFPMSSKTLPPFRKNCRFTWWRFYIPARNFTAQSLRSVCFPHTSWQSHISIQPVIKFSRCRDQFLHQTSKIKENMHSLGKIFWFYFWFIAIDFFRLSILDCWKNIEKLTPCYQFFLITRAENKKTPYEKQNRFLRSIFHTVPGIGLLLVFAFQCISKSMLINVVSHIRLFPLFFSTINSDNFCFHTFRVKY